MNSMFSIARSFDQDISHFDFSATNNSNSILALANNTSLSIANNDKLLKRLYDQLGQNGVQYNLNNTGLKYCLAEPEYRYLTAPVAAGGAGWAINNTKDCSDYPPKILSLSGATTPLTVDENSSVGTVIGALDSSSDVPSDTFTFSTICSVSGAQDGFVTVDGNQLKLAKSPDYEQNTALDICLRVTNSVGETLERNFTINVNNLFELSYDANGATSGLAPATEEKYHSGDSAAAANPGSLAMTGYAFAGWNTQADGKGANYNAGDAVSISGDLKLYAQWRDATPPNQPGVAPDLIDADDSGVSNTDNITSVTRPTFEVFCSESGSTVTLYINSEKSSTVSCGAPGTATVQSTAEFADGRYKVTFTETDSAGNESQHSPELSILIDATAPTGKISAADDSASPTISGTVSELDTTITVEVNGNTYQATNNGDDTWTLPAGTIDELNPGQYQISVVFVDVAGNANTIKYGLKISSPSTEENNSHTTSNDVSGGVEDELSATGENLIWLLLVGSAAFGGGIMLLCLKTNSNKL